MRRARFHDLKGNFVGWGRLLAHAPKALLSAVLRIAFGYRSTVPWISYSATRRLEAFLSLSEVPRVLEFGSGRSTIWFARRAGAVFSVDDVPRWHEAVVRRLKAGSIGNVQCELAQTEAAYSGFMANDATGFDLVMVDGSFRGACVAAGLRLLRPGGILYLDNSDWPSSDRDPNFPLAEKRALDFAKARGCEVTYFTDFAPGQFFVEQGLMIRLPE